MGIADSASDLWLGQSAFRGAESNRLYASRWNAVNHPDSEIQHSLKQLRAASRDLVRNNPYAAGIVQSIADNVTGSEGMRLIPKHANPEMDIARQDRWKIERAWGMWGESYATADGIDSWFETERLIDQTWATDGEVLLRIHRGFDNPYGFAVEMIDADLLDEDFNRPAKDGQNEIVMGVEIDGFGRPVAYHFYTQHPDEMGFRRQRRRVPATDVIHHFVRYRPGQHRGFPLLTPAITRFEMADGYEEAELVAARYHASKMGFIKNVNPDAISLWAQRTMTSGQSGRGDVRRVHRIEKGIIPELDPGQEFQAFDPTHPNDAFEPFLKSILRGIARCAGMSYLTLTGDVGEANYSSMRAGLLPERDHWIVLQNIKARRVIRPVHFDWRRMAMLSGALSLPAGLRDYTVECQGRRWDWVDPAKDLEGIERKIKNGLTSRRREAAKSGADYETIIDESAEDMAYAKAAGVYVGGVDTPPAKASTNGNGNGNGTSPRASLMPYLKD